MHTLLLSNISIDLSNKELVLQEENSWYTTEYFAKYSYPFKIALTDELNVAFGDILSYDSISYQRIIEGKYIFHNKVENVQLFVDSIEGREMSVSIKYEIEEFKSFQKQLNELNLEKKTVNNIYQHANSVIHSNFPQTNYNFPMIHTDKYKPEDTETFNFEKIINKRQNGLFVENEVIGTVMHNRNIIQPLPYLLYVLKQGFLGDGKVLEGDILSDPLLQKLLVYTSKDYFFKNTAPSESITITSIPDGLEMENVSHSYGFTKVFPVQSRGLFNVYGTITIGTYTGYQYDQPNTLPAHFRIKIDGEEVFTQVRTLQWLGIYTVDVNIDIPISSSGNIEIEIRTSDFGEDTIYCDLQLLPIYFYDTDGSKLTTIVNENKIDLTKAVPNISFGDFVSNVLKWFNYDIEEITKEKVVINKVEKAIDNAPIYDLTAFQKLEVSRTSNFNKSFSFKYADEENGIFVNESGVNSVLNVTSKKASNQIQFDCAVGKQEERDQIATAFFQSPTEDKLGVVIYSYNGDTNTTLEPTDLSIENIYYNYHSKWTTHRVFCVGYRISFVAPIEKIVEFNTKSKYYAYNNIFISKSFQKKEIQKDWFEVEIEGESLRL